MCKWAAQGQGRLSSYPPQFLRPLGHPLLPTPSLQWSGLAPFFANLFFLAFWGILRPRAQTVFFHSGRHQGIVGPEKCCPGASRWALTEASSSSWPWVVAVCTAAVSRNPPKNRVVVRRKLRCCTIALLHAGHNCNQTCTAPKQKREPPASL